MDQESFVFRDIDDGDEVTVIVRTVQGGVGLAISRRTDGDVETFIPPPAARRIAEALLASSK